MTETGKSTESQSNPTSPLAPDELLLEQDQAPLLVCSIYEDQRPLKGVAGSLDWRLKGFLSRFVVSGRITGRSSEFVYVPITRKAAVRHLMIVGLGPKDSDHESETPALLKELAQRVSDLNIPRVAVSRSSFPFIEESKIRKALKGVEVEFTQ